MLKPSDLVIATKPSIGTKMLLVDIKPKYEYSNGMKTNNVLGYAYTVVLMDKAYERIDVKIEGAQLMSAPAEGEYTEVEFVDLELYLFWSNGTYAVGARAKGIHAKGKA